MFTQSNTSFKQVDTVLCSHADFDEALEFLSFYVYTCNNRPCDVIVGNTIWW